MAEEAVDQTERKRLIEKSVHHLEIAIYLFGSSTEFGQDHPEVGDCHSLLGRTWLVAGNIERAIQSVHTAAELITQPHSKDYLDLLILQGEMAEASDPGAASVFYDEVLQQERDGDSERSEIVARAYFGRGTTKAIMGLKSEARRDFQEAKKRWQELEEDENSARASWQILKLDGAIPQSVLSLLREESFPVRVSAVQIYQERLKEHSGKNVARRAEPVTKYWKSLIREARTRAAVELRSW